MYAQEEQEATSPQDRPADPQSRSREVLCHPQPEFAAIEAKLQVCDGAIHHLILLRTTACLNRTVVLRFRLYLESLGLAAGTINQRLAAVRRLAYEAADSGLLSPELAAGIRRVKGVSSWDRVRETG